MPGRTQDVLCRYHYDALDRLIGTKPSTDTALKRFYCTSRLATEIQGTSQISIFQQAKISLAQQNRREYYVDTSLLATGQMRSIMEVIKSDCHHGIEYSPYGYRPTNYESLSLLGFNGERAESSTGHYLLGNGYRAYNPALMRFNSPDSLSPFGSGGLNTYMYCLGEPVSRHDESGHTSWSLSISAVLDLVGRRVGKAVQRSSPAKSLGRHHEIINPRNGKPATIIDNKTPPRMIKQEMQEFLSKQKESDELLIRQINSSIDLKSLTEGYSYKFVFTNSGQLIVGGRPGTPAGHILSHPILSQHANSPSIISAGYLQKPQGKNFYTVDNYSGHYKPNIESLGYVAQHIRGMGQRVKVVPWKKSTL